MIVLGECGGITPVFAKLGGSSPCKLNQAAWFCADSLCGRNGLCRPLRSTTKLTPEDDMNRIFRLNSCDWYAGPDFESAAAQAALDLGYPVDAVIDIGAYFLRARHARTLLQMRQAYQRWARQCSAFDAISPAAPFPEGRPAGGLVQAEVVWRVDRMVSSACACSAASMPRLVR